MRVRTRERLRSPAGPGEKPSPAARLAGLREALSSPVDGASLAFFRIGFGALIAWEVWREYDGGAMRVDYVLPDFHYTWWLFDWVRPHHGVGVYIAFGVLAAAGLLVALGLFYRGAALVQALGLTYWFLMEKARYLNHHYLAILFAFLFLLIPAHAAYSLDARRKPWLRSHAVPAWSLWIMRFQVAVPYFFAGVAKVNFDWLVRGEPLRMWLADRTDFPLIGRFFGEALVAHGMAIGSVLLDLSVPFLLLYRRTRTLGYAMALAFHFLNTGLFEIGIFPSMMIVATTIFFEPDWPRRMAAVVRAGSPLVRAVMAVGFAAGFLVAGPLAEGFVVVRAVAGGFGIAFLLFQLIPERAYVPSGDRRRTPWRGSVLPRAMAWLLGAWVIVQLLLPLRHFAIPGNVHWTGDGDRFAWHMLLVQTESSVSFRVSDLASGQTWTEDLRKHVTSYQLSKTKTPDLILQLAHRIADYHRARGREHVVVEVDAVAAMNGRPAQYLIDPGLDLTAISRPYLPPEDWVVRLEPYDEGG